MTFNVLMSCMFQQDFSLIGQSNLQEVPTIIINQCDIQQEEKRTDGIHTMYMTPTRGLSVSRNMAIEKTSADICLIADNDERFCAGLQEKVVSAYERIPDADLIIFRLTKEKTHLGAKTKALKWRDCLRVTSCQISLRVVSIKSKVVFDTNLGAGTNNGAGEDNKFLLDCYKKGMKIYYVPDEIACRFPVDSTWFSGYTPKYFFDQGKTLRYILGFGLAVLYGMYFVVFKMKLYGKELSPLQAGRYLLRGLLAEGIHAPYRMASK